MKGTGVQGKVKSEKLKVFPRSNFSGEANQYMVKERKIQNLFQIKRYRQSVYKNFNFSFFTFNFTA